MMRYLFWLLLPLTLAATRPSTVPSGDPSAPRAALLMYDKLVAGPDDADKALGLYHAATTRDRALAAALAQCDGALANLRAKAAAKYDRDVADAMLHAVYGTTTSDINNAKITVNGDTATVEYPDFPNPATMVRVNGEWKMSVRAMLNSSTTKPRDLRKSLTRLATAVNEIAAKIEQGQYPTAEDASAALVKAHKASFSRETESNGA
jgi:hypothetical protein